MSTDRRTDDTLRIVLILLAVVVLVPLLMTAVAAPMMGMMGWMWTGGMDGGVSPLWGLGMSLVWLIVLVGIGYALYRAFAGDVGAAADDPALEALRLAYARGELSDEEFQIRRETLTRDE